MRIIGLCKFSDARDWLWGKLGLALVGRALLRKSLIQFSAEGAVLPPSSLAVTAQFWSLHSLWQGYSLYTRTNGDLFQGNLCQHAVPPRMLLPVSAPELQAMGQNESDMT